MSTPASPPRCVAIATVLLFTISLPGCVLLPIPDRHGVRALEADQMLVGAWLGSWPSDTNPVVSQFRSETGIPLDLVDVYLDWNTPFANVSYSLSHIAAQGAVPIMTWEPMGYTTQDIIAGQRPVPLRDGRTVSLDSYLAEIAEGTCQTSRAANVPILVRTLHEMNGGWFSWGISFRDAAGGHPNTAESYKQAWTKIHDAFTGRCGDSVRFIWAINHFSKGADLSFMQTYPGDSMVDFVGIDGYNWGSNASWGWQSFDTLFHDPYCALTKGTGRPMLLDEISSSERGGDKAAWIADMYARMKAYDRIRGFVWFDDAKYEVEIHGRMDWALDSSASSLTAFETGARQILSERDGTATPGGEVPVQC
jgi:mannan endo-1,4-beta-mannosidase